MKSDFPLSPKYVDFVNSVKNVRADFLEGTTASGKTTVGAGLKFMYMVSASPKKIHLIAAETVGKAESSIINKDFGILDIHTDCTYNGFGDKDDKIAHLNFEDKTIYVLGYDDRSKWKKALGMQYGCVLIDEINIADIEFIREISTRFDYLLATLNPDNPRLPVYKEFINRSRPYKKYAADVPPSTMKELKEEPVPGWRYWFFSFNDNWGLTPAEIEAKKNSAPKGTKYYRNKILGLRGKATGVIFSEFDSKRIITADEARKMKFVQLSIGVDTAYSQKSADTIAMAFIGITDDRKLIYLDERVYNNRDLAVPIAPSDTIKNIHDFAERNRQAWGFAKDIYIDSADAATLTEATKYKRDNYCVYNFIPAYKKTKIVDRILLQGGWIHNAEYFVVDTCKEHIGELEVYSWKEEKDNEPEDANDHTINAGQYAWLPYVGKIGAVK